MSDADPRTTRNISPWWLLVLVPLPLFIGHLIGGVSVPTPPKPARASAGAMAATHLAAPPTAPAPGAPSGSTPTATVEGVTPSPSSAGGDESAPESEASGGGVHWVDLSQALAESQRSGKPVMFDFNADWCPPCQAMKHRAFADPGIARSVEAVVVPVSIVDRQRETGSNVPDVDDLQRRFQIRAFPTLVVINPTTGHAVKQEGFSGPEGTQAWIRQAAEAVK